MRLSEIAKVTHGVISSEKDVEITNVAKIEDARPGDITFLSNLKYKKYLRTTLASAVLISNDAQFEELQHRKIPISPIRVIDPYQSFLQLIDIFSPPPKPLPIGVHKTAVVAATATIGTNVGIGAHVVIGEHCIIGAYSAIHPGTVLGDHVQIGSKTLIHPNVTIREQSKIGNNVIIHSGTVVGSDGFGFAPKEDGSYEKIPQRGTVVIEDDVEIGANSTIDRATIGETRIMRGTKLDNLIHIAHNVIIGEHTVMAAQTGISGSSKVGNYCSFGGQVGLTGHITIADHTQIGAQSGVPKSIEQPGKIWFGYPAKELHETLKIQAVVGQLPTLLYEIRNLQKRIEELEQALITVRKNVE
jgi:UDP-3-O-[3-hydroxymyristoyl] glucosamine N-acyltransferase